MTQRANGTDGDKGTVAMRVPLTAGYEAHQFNLAKRSWTAHTRIEVCGLPRQQAAHNAITGRVCLTGPRRDYRALHLGRYRAVR